MPSRKNYAGIVNAPVPQSEQAHPDQVPNSAGGFSFQVDTFQRVRRFLILGSDGGTFYISERKLTLDNMQSVLQALKENGRALVDLIVEVSQQGLAPKNDAAIFALVLASCPQYADRDTVSYALSKMPYVCRTATHLFQFLGQLRQFRGMGRAVRRAIGNWYETLGASSVAYQVVKYRNREGYAHSDVLRLAHPITQDVELNAVYRWLTADNLKRRTVTRTIAGKKVKTTYPNLEKALPQFIVAYEAAKAAKSIDELCEIIRTDSLVREAVPNEHLNKPEVWDALMPSMPYIAMIRNLATMTRTGLFDDKKYLETLTIILDRITNEKAIQRSRVHPLAIYAALRTYGQGEGERSSKTWTPNHKILKALDDAFYASFKAVEPTNLNLLLAVDVSASMGAKVNGMPYLTCAGGGALMSLITLATEPFAKIIGFGTRVVTLGISPSSRVDEAIAQVNQADAGGTDCAAPIFHAIAHKMKLDAIILYTDSETWAGRTHPHIAMERYRKEINYDAKLIIVAMEANEFTVGDVNDPLTLQVAGLDTSTPQIISSFLRGEI